MTQGEAGAFVLVLLVVALSKDPPTCADLPDTCAAMARMLFVRQHGSSW